jgi:large subunit ribosomal protein L25
VGILMETPILNAELRTDLGKGYAKKLRRDGKVPANFYFHGEKNRHLVLNTIEIKKFLSSRHNIIDLKVPKVAKTLKCLVREVQYEPVRGSILHVDLMGVKLTEKIVVDIPIILKGIPKGVRDEGGIIHQELRELHIECLAKDLPEVIEIEISDLVVGNSFLVRQLSLPNITILNTQDQPIVSVKGKTVEKETTAQPVETETEVEATEEKSKPK